MPIRPKNEFVGMHLRHSGSREFPPFGASRQTRACWTAKCGDVYQCTDAGDRPFLGSSTRGAKHALAGFAFMPRGAAKLRRRRSKSCNALTPKAVFPGRRELQQTVELHQKELTPGRNIPAHALHVTREIERGARHRRTLLWKRAIWPTVGKLLVASHQSSRELVWQ